MNPKLKAMLIADYGLKADATDEEAVKFMEDNKIKVIDSTEKPQAQKQQAADNSGELKNKIQTVQTELNSKLDGLEQQIASMNISLKDNAEGDPQLGYKSNTEFFMDVISAGRTGRVPEKLVKAHEIRLKNAVGSDEAKVANNPDGGFLIPPAYFPEVLKTDSRATQTDTGALTRRVPIAVATIHFNARVDKNHSSSVSGGFQIYRREETASVTATKATFEQITLQANSLMGLAYATNEILDRSPVSFAPLIQSGFEDERVSKLNNERLNGTGVGQYLGVLNAPCLISVAKESGQSADTIVAANVLKMRARIWGYGNAVWMVNQDCYEQLAQLYISGTNGDVFIFNPARSTDVPDMLLGRPVIYDENMQTLGDKGDIMLINWREYLEGQRGGSSFSESVHVRFEYNESAFKFVVYNAGAPWWRTALTPKNSSSTLSPFISLNART